MLKFVFLSKIFNLSSLAFETKRKRLIGGKLAIVLTFFLSQVSSFSYAQSALFPEQSVSYQFLKSENSEAVQERQVTYIPVAGGLKVETGVKGLVREYLIHDIDFSYNLVKKGNGYYADFSSVISAEHMNRRSWERFGEDYEGDAVFYPEQLSIGLTLPEARGKIKVFQANETFAYDEFSLTDRRVTTTEDLTILGQKHSAYVLVSKYSFKSNHLNSDETITQWIVRGKGIVKELRNINGKLIISEIK